MSATTIQVVLQNSAIGFTDHIQSESMVKKREEFNDQTSQFKAVGVIILIAATALGLFALGKSLWLLALLTTVPILIGREIIVISSNAKNFVDQSVQKALASHRQINRSATEFASTVSSGTCLMSCVLNCFPGIVGGLHQGYRKVLGIN